MFTLHVACAVCWEKKGSLNIVAWALQSNAGSAKWRVKTLTKYRTIKIDVRTWEGWTTCGFLASDANFLTSLLWQRKHLCTGKITTQLHFTWILQLTSFLQQLCGRRRKSCFVEYLLCSFVCRSSSVCSCSEAWISLNIENNPSLEGYNWKCCNLPLLIWLLRGLMNEYWVKAVTQRTYFEELQQ